MIPQPRLTSSLFSSCSRPDFYANIQYISMKRATGFLLFISFLVSLFFYFSASFYFSKQDLRMEEIMGYYDRYLPEFEMSFHESKLQTLPPELTYFFTIDEHQSLQLQTRPLSNALFTLQVNSQTPQATFLSTPPKFAGVYFLQDAILFFNGAQNTVVEYTSLPTLDGVPFSKATVRPLLEQQLPDILNWAKRVTLQLGTGLIFFYSFFSVIILAFLSSLFGMPTLLIRRQAINYWFLIKLSFYAITPALFIMLTTYLLSISVSFLPLFIYFCFYSYGLMVYEAHEQSSK